MAEAPTCKKCGAVKVILKGKKNNYFIGCPNCTGKPAGGSQSEPHGTAAKNTPAPKKPAAVPSPEKKTKRGFWW